MKISGQLFIGEASAWGAKASQPLSGHPWPMVWSNVVGSLVGIVCIFTAGILQSMGLAPGWIWAVGILTGVGGGVWATLRVCRSLVVRHFRKALLARDVQNPLPASMQVADGWLSTNTGVIETRAPLIAVSDISKIGPYWVLIIQGGAHFIPLRTFTSSTEELEFLRAIDDGISSAARRRSPDLTRALS